MNAVREPDPPHHDILDVLGTDAGARRLRSAVRRTEPTARLARTLHAVEDVAGVTRSQQQVFRTIERLTGLRHGELQTLTAVAGGATHHREVARRTGQVDAAAEATVDWLVGRGLLARHHHPQAGASSEPTLVHVTASGTVALQQAEALQVRLLDSVLGALDEEESARLRAAVEQVQDTLGPAAGPRPVLAAGLLSRA
ncbi:hypothetical protein [Georgenia sp. AZ-5]|uniref:hypothetical protein n=1 Tax=Georgenia sp. AZ-5 TaxID=3367526 RepID=UPI0037541D3F